MVFMQICSEPLNRHGEPYIHPRCNREQEGKPHGRPRIALTKGHGRGTRTMSIFSESPIWSAGKEFGEAGAPVCRFRVPSGYCISIC